MDHKAAVSQNELYASLGSSHPELAIKILTSVDTCDTYKVQLG